MEFTELAIWSKCQCAYVGAEVEGSRVEQRLGRPMSSGPNLALEVGTGGIFGQGLLLAFEHL